MFESKAAAKKFLRDFAIAFFPPFLSEMSKSHDAKGVTKAALSAFTFALPAALDARLMRGDKKKVRWRESSFFALIFGICLLVKWQKIGPHLNAATIYSALIVAAWISAMAMFAWRLWQQAEGSGEEYPSADAQFPPTTSS